MKKLEPNQAIITWLQKDPPSHPGACLEEHDEQPFIRRFLYRKTDDGGWQYTTNPDEAKIFTVSDAYDAIMEFRNLYKGMYVSIEINPLGYIPDDYISPKSASTKCTIFYLPPGGKKPVPVQPPDNVEIDDEFKD